MSTRVVVLLVMALAGCTSHEPDVLDPFREEVEETLASRAPPDDPTTWAARVVGDEVVEIAVLADGSSVVVTDEGATTAIDPHVVIARHDPFGQPIDMHELPTRVGTGQRLFAIDGEGRLVALAVGGTVLHVLERDGTIVRRTIEWPRKGVTPRAVRGYPDGGFLVRAEVPRARDADEYAWWSPSATHLLARFDVAPADPKQPWHPSWMIEIGDDFAEDPRAFGPIDVLSDGRIATVARCQDTTGRRCRGSNGRELGVWSKDGEPQMRLALPSELDVVLAAGEHTDGGIVAVARTTSEDDEDRPDVFVARFGPDGQKVAGYYARIPDLERVDHAAIASGVVWVAVTQRFPITATRRGAVAKVDAGTQTVEVFGLAPRDPTPDLSPADVLRPTRVAAARGRVRVAGWYGSSSRLEFPDGTSIDVELFDPRGIDDDVVVWAASGRSAWRR